MNLISKFIMVVFLFTGLQTFAKNESIKFGNVNPDDVSMTIYAPDSSAHAVVLYDWGESFFELNGPQGAFYRVDRIKRIKVLTKEGLDYANISIPIYHSGGAKEKLGAVKGFTYNLENGKVVKTKLDKNSLHLENTTKYYETTKVTFPNVKPGSVIEIKYSVSSNLFGNLRGWDFQYPIPVRTSEFRIDIPEYFHYQIHQKGYEKVDTHNQDRVSSEGIFYNRYYWKTQNIPAFKDEPFMINRRGFVTGLDFELSMVNIPGIMYEDYSSSWTIIKDELLTVDGYGRELAGGSYLKDVVKEINASNKNERAKLEAAFKYIQTNMKWNEGNGIYTSATLRKAFNDKEGNSADINLMLNVLLKKLGIDSSPVLICSRNKGLFNMYVAKRSAFDRMIVAANIDSTKILLDATDKICGCGDLPHTCQNSQGLLIAPGKETWIDLTGAQARKRMVCTLNLADIENVKANIVFNYVDYSAYMFRKRMEDKDDEEIVEEFEDQNDWISVNEYTIKGMDDVNNPIGIEYTCEISDFIEENGDRLYINPIVAERQESNPFTLQDRKFPVDFGYSQKEEIFVTINCPEEYEFETLPEPMRIALPNNSGSFTYMLQKNGFSLQLMCKVEIKKANYSYAEYHDLKEFFNQIVDKQSEMIVLKKRS